MFDFYKKLFCFRIQLLDAQSSAPIDKDSNGTNMDEIIDAIARDKKINGSDSLLVNNLLDALENQNQQITEETKNEISSHLSQELEKSLALGYTIIDEASYQTYIRIMKFVDPDVRLPEYETIKSTALNSGLFEAEYSFVYHKNDKTISVHYVELPHGVSGSAIGKIKDGVYIPGNDLTSWDDYSNNNQFNLGGDDIDALIPDSSITYGPQNGRPNNGPDLPITYGPQNGRPNNGPDLPITYGPQNGRPNNGPDLPITYGPQNGRPNNGRPNNDTDSSVVESRPIQEPAKEEIAVTPTRYTVQKGDTMWAIVKNHYELTDNTEIANAVNFVVESQTEAKLQTQLSQDTYGDNQPNVKDGIKGDVIYPGDVIILPPLK